jgi:hypothetical protein
MEENEFRMMAGRLLAAIARMDQRDHRLEQQLPAIMEEQTARWLRTVTGQVETATRAGLESPLAACEQRVHGLTAETDKVVIAMQGARRGLTSIQRWVMIAVCVSLLLSIIALFGTYHMLYGHYQTRYDELKSQVTYLDAVDHSDVVPCGEGRLCARIDDKAQRVGDKKQYRLIELRR